jgi:hypothetical protein
MLMIRHKNKNGNLCVSDHNIFDIVEQRVFSGHLGATVIVPHVCNNINLFGAGFAAAVAAHYPEVKENFHLLGNKAKLGHVQFVTTKTDKQYRRNLIIANMIAQNKTINKNTNPRPLNYEALVNCMVGVRNFVKNLSQTEHDKVEIHCPKFGCGLAGGEWSFVSSLITDIWSEIDVFVYVLKSK